MVLKRVPGREYHPNDICPINHQSIPVIVLTVRHSSPYIIIEINHDTVCAGVVGTAIRHSTSCDVRVTRLRSTSATANLGFHSETSLAMYDDLSLNE